MSIEKTYGTFYNHSIVTLAHLAPFLRSWNYSQICAADSEDMVILACTVLIVAECDEQTGRLTDTRSKTDASTTANMREELHTVACELSCAVLNFACFDLLVCIVTRSREKSHSLSLVQFLALALAYRSIQNDIGFIALSHSSSIKIDFSCITWQLLSPQFPKP